MLDIALMSLYTTRQIWEHLKPAMVSAQLRQSLLIGQNRITFHKFHQNVTAAPWEPHSADWHCPSWKHLQLEGRKLFSTSPLPCVHQSLMSLPYYQKSTLTIRHSSISRNELSFQSPVASRSGSTVAEAMTSADFHPCKLKCHNPQTKEPGFHIFFPVCQNEYSIIYKKWSSFSKQDWNAPIGMLER